MEEEGAAEEGEVTATMSPLDPDYQAAVEGEVEGEGDTEGHRCIYLDHAAGGELRLEAAPCRAEIARPLCQYRRS